MPNTINSFFIGLIRKYQKDISPQLQKMGVRCLFEQSCSHYAIHCLENHNFITASFRIGYRLLSCNPINARRIGIKT